MPSYERANSYFRLMHRYNPEARFFSLNYSLKFGRTLLKEFVFWISQRADISSSCDGSLCKYTWYC